MAIRCGFRAGRGFLRCVACLAHFVRFCRTLSPPTPAPYTVLVICIQKTASDRKQFILGTLLVLFSTWLYSGPERKGRPPPINIATYEKTVIASTPRVPSPDGTRLLNPMDSATLGLTTSRPATPLRHHARKPSARGKTRDD